MFLALGEALAQIGARVIKPQIRHAP
jgi:hypothetical protein